jgi:hypothetical protein
MRASVAACTPWQMPILAHPLAVTMKLVRNLLISMPSGQFSLASLLFGAVGCKLAICILIVMKESNNEKVVYQDWALLPGDV